MIAFPFSALVGQEDLREALLACAVDPAIGGVLVRGERGTAKTTAVRGLAPLLPPPASLVELPIGATADRVLGTLDLDRALAEGKASFQPGLLATAHRGLLYVDEVNLLPDHLVDVLLDAAALGRVHVERDGLSEAYDARFLLVGTMNPEEGELRPQLLDRFGLSIEVTGSADPAVRVEIVRRRLAFDRDPERFVARWKTDEQALGARVAVARERLERVRLADRILLLIAGVCARLGVDGHRADIVCARTAVALAALDGADEVDAEHVRRAARLALGHRRRRGPLQQPGLDDAELDDALAEADGDDPDPDGGGSRNAMENGRGEDAGGENGRVPDGARSDAAGEASTHPGDARDGHQGDPHDERDRPDEPARDDRDHAERPYRHGAPSRERLDAPGATGRAPFLALAGEGSGAAGRRSRTSTGEPVDSRAPTGTVTDLALAPTLRAAATRRALAQGPPAAGPPPAATGDATRPVPAAGPPRAPRATARRAPAAGPALVAADLREHVRSGREGNLVVFCVDASGSMGARRRMAHVKGAVLGLLTDAYQRRDRVALVTFRGDGAHVALPPTSSVERAAAALANLPTGGRTPLAAGLRETEQVIRTEARRDPTRRALAIVVTDGRAHDRAASIHAIQSLAKAAAGIVVLDGEQGPVRLGLAQALADAAGAQLLPLEDAA